MRWQVNTQAGDDEFDARYVEVMTSGALQFYDTTFYPHDDPLMSHTEKDIVRTYAPGQWIVFQPVR